MFRSSSIAVFEKGCKSKKKSQTAWKNLLLFYYFFIVRKFAMQRLASE